MAAVAALVFCFFLLIVSSFFRFFFFFFGFFFSHLFIYLFMYLFIYVCNCFFNLGPSFRLHCWIMILGLIF